jgi:DNA invertase Pin-like site-specific DNA recombinase
MKSEITNQANTPLQTLPAYIYSRVSKVIQAEEGQGISRQIDRAHQFIDMTNKRRARDNQPTYKVVDDLIIDKGLSAYIGANTAENAGLGAFLEGVKSGRIPPKSLLVVEAVDRISRLEPNKARKIFMELAEYKIDVAITKFNLIVYHDNSNDFASDLLLTVGFHLAHLESQQKSERIKASFELKRKAEDEGGEKRTSICPAWMNLSSCKTKFVLKQPEASVLKRIFSMKLGANIGSNRIAQILNSEGIPSFTGGEWYSEIVLKYLKMIQTYGAFQPTNDDYSTGKRVKVPSGPCKENYYPSVVTKDEFDRVQASLRRSTKGQASPKYRNLYSGLTKCVYCGGPLSYSKPNRGKPKLRCRNSINKQCNLGSVGNFDYQQIETLLLKSFSSFDFRNLNYESPDQRLQYLESEIERYSNELDELEKEIDEEQSSRLRRRLSVKFNEKEIALDTLIEKRTELYSLQTVPEISELLPELESLESRAKYNKHISSFVEYVIFAHHCLYIKFKGNLGTVQLSYADKHYKKHKSGFLTGSEIIEAKVIKRINLEENEVFQVDVDRFVEERNQKFAKLGVKAIAPQDNDLLASLRFVHSVMRENDFRNTNAGVVGHMLDIAEKIAPQQV